MASYGVTGSQDDYGDATPDDLIATIDECSKEARDARASWIEEANECYNFVAGHQWTDDELQALKDQRRPPVTFDRTGPIVDVICGLEVSNRQEVQYLQREAGDAGADEVMTGAAKWARDECDAEDEESEAFRDMFICGEGWTDTRLDYEYDADGLILTERIDPLEILPDPSSKKKNYKDANYLIREKMVSVLWLKETWADKAEEIDGASELREADREFSGEAHQNVAGDQYRGPGSTPTARPTAKRELKLTEYQYKKREPFFRIQDPATGEMAEFSPEEHDQIQERAVAMMGQRLQSVRQTKCKHYRAFKVGQVLLENELCPDPNSYTYKAMTGHRDRKKRCWYGVIRKVRDAQRWANKFFSQSMFIFNTNAKGGWLIEKDAVEDIRQFEESIAHPDKPTYLMPGALVAGKIQAKNPPAFPTQLAQLLEFCLQSIYQITGVNPEMLGSVDRDQPGVLEYQRKQAGITILATLFDGLRKYRKEQGRNLLYLINTYISDGRLVRIVGRDGAKYVPLRKAEGFGRYDVIIDESPSAPNQKEKTWVVLQTLLPLMIKSGIPIPPQILDFMPLPQSLLDQIKKPDPAKEQEQQQMKQMALQEKQADIAKTEAEAKKADAEAMSKMVDAGLKKAEIEGQQTQMQHKLISETMATQKKAELEQWKAQQDAALEVWKAQQLMTLERQTAEFRAGLQRQTAAADMAIQRDKLNAEQELKGRKG